MMYDITVDDTKNIYKTRIKELKELRAVLEPYRNVPVMLEVKKIDEKLEKHLSIKR